MGSSSKKNILQTLAYADIFDSPLKKDEIWHLLISNKRIDKKVFEKDLGFFFKKDGFYCFSGRSHIIKLRQEKEKESIQKIRIARKIAMFLSLVPTVYFIGISGSLAVKGAKPSDDIDFFVITKRNALWVTRLIILSILEFLKKRRKRSDKNVKNKICVNMIIDETALSFSLERQDLYTAHEIVQMIPLFERNNIFKKFIAANLWVKKFLPNSLDVKKFKYEEDKKENRFLNLLISLMETFAKKIQLWKIQKHRTKETILDNFLAFHPVDYRMIILSLYKKNVKRYGKI